MAELPSKIDTIPNIEHIESKIEVGQWYWVKDQEFVGYSNVLEREKRGESYPDDDEFDEGEPIYKDYEWFGCVTDIGSNYINIKAPRTAHSSGCSSRVHIDEFDDICRREQSPKQVIQDNSQRVQALLRGKMHEINQLTARLGLRNTKPIHMVDGDNATDTLLPVHNHKDDIDNYKNDLIYAKETQLPELFKELEELNDELIYWLNAEVVPMEAMATQMRESTNVINDRIFNVELYSGLMEDVVLVRDGEAANIDEKLRIMQRRCYMDEECLIDYQHGGMNFRRIEAFDKWLSKKNNMDRILPFQKCIVSFRVRRDKKDYDLGTHPLIRVWWEKCDNSTFLYMRNGEKLFRLNTTIDFGEKLFPDTSEFHPGEKIWANFFAGDIQELVPDRVYQDRLRRENERQRLKEEWEEQNPGKHWMHNPHRHAFFCNLPNYEPCDSSSVYFDDIMNKISIEAKQYNRVALIIQGLLDRSEVFHPHIPVQIWKADDFKSIISLIYDAEMVLTSGEAPDFEEYRAHLNASMGEGSVVVGQQDYWLRREAEKENKRQENDWRIKHAHTYKHFKPYGNPGPGLVARVKRFQPKLKKCWFEWHRDRMSFRWNDNNNKIRCTIGVPAENILNIDAYTPGDYHKFFDDPRTRVNYIQWAPLLLVAEDYHAGKITL